MRPHTSYHGNLYWRNEEGKECLKQIFINDRYGILIHAKELAKDKQGVLLCLVAMHYDRNAYNDHSDYYWFDCKDGEFIDVRNKYK